MKLLASLNPSKACGPDDILHWLLKEYADLLAFPISKIINSCLKEQSLPRIWKFTDVSPLPKAKQVEVLKKQVRPISLTTCLSKVAEDCIIVDYVKPAELQALDPNQVQFQNHLPPNNLFRWFIIGPRKHGNGATVRVTLFE